MYSQKFLAAVSHVLAFEGGFADNKYDSGGRTKYGISQRQYPNLDISSLTKAQATELYFKDYWSKTMLDEIEEDVCSTKIFDLLINAGQKASALCAQRAIRSNQIEVAEDGKLGPQTVNAINHIPPVSFLAALRSEAAGYYRNLVAMKSDQKVFLNGWLRRAYS